MQATTTGEPEHCQLQQAGQGCWRGWARRCARQQQQQQEEEEQQLAPGLKADLRANVNIVRHHPATLLVPLLLLAVLLTAGVVGVVWGASNEATARQRYATGQAESYAIRIRARLQQVYPAVGQLIYAIRRQPSSWAKLNEVLADAADEIFHLANGTVSAIGLAPQGHFLTQYNSVNGSHGPIAQQQQMGEPQVMGLPALGLDLFAPNSSGPTGHSWRDLALYAMEAGGPVFSSAAHRDDNGSLGVVFLSPVFVPVSTNCSTGVGSDVRCNNVTGQPAGNTTLPVDVTAATNCTRCLESRDGLTFWGMLLVVTDLHLALADAGLTGVQSGDVVQGYRYTVQAPNRAVGQAGDWDQLTTVAQSRLPVVRPVRVEVAMDTSDDSWVLELSPEKGSWNPSWTWPLVALVVCVSLTLAALQLRVALAAHRHRLLLEALLPAEVLNDLRREHDYSSPKLAELATGTPAQSILNLTSSVLHGELPDAREAVMVRAAVLRRADIYRPSDLSAKIKASNLDDDVAHALMRQLACSDSGGVPLPTWPGSLMGQGLPMYVGSTRSDFDGPPSSRRASSQAPEVFATLQSALAAIITRAPETMWHPGIALPPAQSAAMPSGLPPLSKHRSQELSGFVGSAMLMADYPCIEDPGDTQPAGGFPEGPASQPAMQLLATASQAGWAGVGNNPLYGRSSAGAVGGASCYGAAAMASLATTEGAPRNAVASYPRQPRSQRQSGSPKAAAAAAASVSINAVAGPGGSPAGGAGTAAGGSGPPGESSWSPGLGSLNNLIASYYRRRSSCTSTTLGGTAAVPSPALTAGSGATGVEGGDRATAGTASDVFSVSDAGTAATAGYAAVHRSRSMAPSTLTRSSSVSMPFALWEEAERSLSLSWEWQFDAPALAAATQGHPLSTLGFYVLTTTGLARRFKIKPDVLARYLCRVEGLYIDNPYHNAMHAADVLQTMHVLIQRGGLVQHGYTDPLAQLACYMAAIVHDLGHPGRTNDFLIATSDDLAVRYNDKAPLENHHVSQAFALLRQPGLNFLAALSRDERCMLRRMVIELVLGTDMKQHFALLAQFNTLKQAASVSSHASSLLPTLAPPSPVAAPNESEASVVARALSNARSNSVLYRTSRTLADMASSPRGRRHSALVLAPAGAARAPADCTGAAAPPLPQSPVVVDEAGRLLVLQLALKCADLGHLAATLPVHLHWVAALEEEMFRQGDAEKAAGLPVSPLFDRAKPGITKSQLGFLDIVVLPLFRGISTLLPRAQPLAEAVHSNYAYWLSQQQHTTAASSPGRGSPNSSAPTSPQKAPECSEEQV